MVTSLFSISLNEEEKLIYDKLKMKYPEESKEKTIFIEGLKVLHDKLFKTELWDDTKVNAKGDKK